MKRVVICEDLHESQIRPEPLYRKYKSMLEAESRAFFGRTAGLSPLRCPSCGERPKPAWEKWGAWYGRCSCQSLLVCPRPSEKALADFRGRSKAQAFWRRVLEKAEARQSSMYQPRLQWLLSSKDEYRPPSKLLAGYGAQSASFLDLVRRSGEFTVVPGLKKRVGVLLAFEVLERLADPGALFRDAAKAVAPGGLLLMTTGTASGLEYQVLGSRAPNLNPLDRLNLFSIEALQGLLAKAGFELLELSTPGRLDLETVERVLESQPGAPDSGFWRYFFAHRGQEARRALQEFLQQYQLSSHVRLAARKR